MFLDWSGPPLIFCPKWVDRPSFFAQNELTAPKFWRSRLPLCTAVWQWVAIQARVPLPPPHTHTKGGEGFGEKSQSGEKRSGREVWSLAILESQDQACRRPRFAGGWRQSIDRTSSIPALYYHQNRLSWGNWEGTSAKMLNRQRRSRVVQIVLEIVQVCMVDPGFRKRGEVNIKC